MIEKIETAAAERVILAGLCIQRNQPELFEEDLEEMVMLCNTAGAEVIETIVQRVAKPQSSTYFGKGKLLEIAEAMKTHDCKAVVIDAELRPSQIQNIEKIVEGKVIDRSQLILDIFALHAKTNESKIQVELAQLEILYPRLTRMWEHLSRVVAGVGTRGPGETQLETDRRLVQKKIVQLKDRLKKIEKNRKTQQKSRREEFLCALVGYTNVGKSTLLNAMSGADILVEDKLFATLDTSSRKTYLPGVGEIILSDTVGFLRKLPHHLVASFRSTLEIVLEADLLLIVMDASSTWYTQQMETVQSVLKDLGAEKKAIMVIFNKADLIEDEAKQVAMEKEFPNACFTEAYNKERIQDFKQSLSEKIIELKRAKLQEELITNSQRPYIQVG